MKRFAPLLTILAFGGEAFAEGDTEPPVITHVRIANAPINQPIAVRARIEDASEVFAPSVYVRAVGSEMFDNIPMTKVEDGYQAIIPAEQVTQAIEYFIEAFDEQGNGPAREGTPEQPIRVLVFDPKSGPPPPGGGPPPPPPAGGGGGVATKWWFWTIIVGVVVVGAGTGIVLATRAGPVGSVDVEVHGPDPTSGL